jgi:hypothetical protein
MAEANLDALCDLLEDEEDSDDDSFDEEIFNLVDEQCAKILDVEKPKSNKNNGQHTDSGSQQKPTVSKFWRTSLPLKKNHWSLFFKKQFWSCNFF